MKKTFVFVLMAMVMLFMLAAIPSTAGPVQTKNALVGRISFSSPRAIAASSITSTTTRPLYDENSPPFPSVFIAVPLINTRATASHSRIASAAMMTALMGRRLLVITALGRRLTFNLRDRMHRLPRDQDCPV